MTGRRDAMPVRTLGAAGPTVSLLGLGCNNFGWRIAAAPSRTVIDAAIDAGITLFDTADVYGETRSEAFLGEALGARRAGLVLVTKFGLPVPGAPDRPGGSAEYVAWAIEGSLRRLRTDVIDVYMYHRPDGITPIAETIEALGDVVRQGKARYVGISNADAGQIREAADAAARAGVPFVAAENRYSVLRRDAEDDVIPACEANGAGLLPFYPLESGLLTGKYRRGQEAPAGSRFASSTALWPTDTWVTDDTLQRVERIEAFAGARGRSLLDVALGGLAATPTVSSIIAGATRPEQVRANAAALGWQPTADDLSALRAL